MNVSTPSIIGNDNKKCENISRTISNISQQEPINNNNNNDVMIIDENDHVIRMYLKFIEIQISLLFICNKYLSTH